VFNLSTQNFSDLVQGEHCQIRGWIKWRGKKLAISRKWWNIRPRLLSITDRKWHTCTSFQTK